jgi:hypothetical protein
MDERIAVGGSGLCRHRRWKRKFCFVLVKFDLLTKQWFLNSFFLSRVQWTRVLKSLIYLFPDNMERLRGLHNSNTAKKVLFHTISGPQFRPTFLGEWKMRLGKVVNSLCCRRRLQIRPWPSRKRWSRSPKKEDNKN